MTDTALNPGGAPRSEAAMNAWRTREFLGRLALYLFLCALTIFVLFPILWMASSSFKPQSELFAREMTLLPVDWTLASYIAVWQGTSFPTYFINSFKIAVASTALSVFVGMYAAYAIARINFRGRYAFGMLLLIAQMFPQIMLVIPLFIVVQKAGLLNTHIALIVCYTAFSLPFTVWMMRGFFESIPQELEDAAAVDGAGILTTFHKIVLPLAGPGLAAVTIFAFIRSWNEFLFALVFLQSRAMFTMPIGLASFQEEYTFRWDLIMAGASIITLPILFFFLLMQKFIVAGLLGGAVKG
jgi:ABC-type glycerol-3-phosphate transport system permease component